MVASIKRTRPKYKHAEDGIEEYYVYIASDGYEFGNRSIAQEYEDKLTRENIKEELKKLRVYYVVHIKLLYEKEKTQIGKLLLTILEKSC